jgi:hypothetical protein
MLPRSAYLSDRQFVQAPFLLNPADFPLGAADRQFWPLTRKASLRVWHHYNNLHPPRHMGEGLMLGGPKIPLDIHYVPNSPSAGEMQYLRQRLNLDLHHHCIVFYSMEKAMEMEWGFFLQQGGFHANELLVVNFVDDPRVLISD